MDGETVQDMEQYIVAAANAGVVLTPGLAGPGTSGTTIYSSGFTIEYGWAAPGIILHQETFVPLWRPLRGNTEAGHL
jgi:hypothetical protein